MFSRHPGEFPSVTPHRVELLSAPARSGADEMERAGMAGHSPCRSPVIRPSDAFGSATNQPEDLVNVSEGRALFPVGIASLGGKMV